MKTLPLLLSLLAACDPSGPRSEGWAVSKKTGGPEVLWDTQATPLPEIPLPNDAATRLDPTSPTGRRINVSVEAGKTVYEQEIRAEFNRMDGFGTYAPIFASFDAPLDLDNLVERLMRVRVPLSGGGGGNSQALRVVRVGHPARLLPAMLSLLEPPKLGAAAHATLARFATLIQTTADKEGEADAAAEEELQGLVEQVRQLGLNKGQ